MKLAGLKELLALEESIVAESLSTSDVAKVKEALLKQNVSANDQEIRALLSGGDSTYFSQFVYKLEKIGFDSAATSYEENKAFWKKIGVTKAIFNKACKD
jgi:hypothetical protein